MQYPQSQSPRVDLQGRGVDLSIGHLFVRRFPSVLTDRIENELEMLNFRLLLIPVRRQLSLTGVCKLVEQLMECRCGACFECLKAAGCLEKFDAYFSHFIRNLQWVDLSLGCTSQILWQQSSRSRSAIVERRQRASKCTLMSIILIKTSCTC